MKQSVQQHVTKVLSSPTWRQLVAQQQLGQVPRLGRVLLGLDARGAVACLTLLDLDERRPEPPAHAESLEAKFQAAFERYVEGDAEPFADMVLTEAPSAFAARVRAALQAIPRGTVATYGELAQRVGSPAAARAIGRACATNPIPLVVPCHRVVATHGLGGYGLGLRSKRVLLELEGYACH